MSHPCWWEEKRPGQEGRRGRKVPEEEAVRSVASQDPPGFSFKTWGRNVPKPKRIFQVLPGRVGVG